MARNWPKVSIVTPSFNQGQFLEETILSVLSQGYPALEYIIIDGGSADNSAEIIRKHQKSLAYWVSEPDRGQSHAINKGMERASGEVIAWLNSDDTYTEGAIFRAVEALQTHAEVGMVYSDYDVRYETTGEIKRMTSRLKDCHSIFCDVSVCPIPQPTVFLRRSVWDEVGPLNESLHLAMDYDLWVRVLKRHAAFYLSGTSLAVIRYYANAKTFKFSHRQAREFLEIFDRTFNDPDFPSVPTHIKKAAYVYAYLRCAVGGVRAEHAYLDGVKWLARSLRIAPVATTTLMARKFLKSFGSEPI